MSDFTGDFLQSLFIIFAIVDPFASLPLVITFTSKMNREEQRSLINTAAIVAGFTLVLFAMVGKYILDFLSISIAALMIAGGILMLILGVEMVREGDKPRGRNYQDIDVSDIVDDEADAGIVPIGIPMLAGPGSISLVILLFSKMNSVAVILAILVVIFASWLMFMGAPFISKAMGEKGAKVMTRIMGLLVAGFAIQFMLDGILEWYTENF